MTLMLFFYKVWLSITATNIVSLTMVFRLMRQQFKDIKDSLDFQNEEMFDDDMQPYYSSQLEKLRRENTIRIAIVDDKAYWVHNNTFYETEIINGKINNDGARPIDAHKLSSKQLNNLLEILDNIKK